MSKTINVVFFPEELIELNRELANTEHEVLAKILAQVPADEIEMRIGQIAAYCEVMLDGTYDHAGIMQICKICTNRLQEKRGKVQIPIGSHDGSIEKEIADSKDAGTVIH